MKKIKLLWCTSVGRHQVKGEELLWCDNCDTGICNDCGYPIYWHEPEGWRHIDRDRTCFLIQDNTIERARIVRRIFGTR